LLPLVVVADLFRYNMIGMTIGYVGPALTAVFFFIGALLGWCWATNLPDQQGDTRGAPMTHGFF
jgi:nicotinamide riboside transporter PnuC